LNTPSYTPARHEGPAPRLASLRTAEALVEALLVAHRDAGLPQWLQGHRRVAAWLSANLLGPVRGSAGEALQDESDDARAVAWLLGWAVTQLRPDRAPASTTIGRDFWLAHTSWRPMLAVSCHYGFLPVPAFRDRYHAQPGEAAASQLCGLWSVGPSTYYRYLDKAKRALAMLLRSGILDARQRLALRSWVQQRVAERPGGADEAAQRAWHARQAARDSGDALSALWHLRQAGETEACIALLTRRAAELAVDPETTELLDSLAAEALLPRQRFDLALGQATLWRLQGQAERELAAYEQALRIAAEADDALMLGRVYSALGRFHEPRDADRALACYQDCTDCLFRAGVGSQADAGDVALVEEFVVALVRIAWSHMLRNDPRSRAALDRAEALRHRVPLALPTLAMLEQTWGEYWRRSADLPRSLEHKHRALNLYERAQDHEAVLKTCCNLSLVYGEAKDFARAIDYARRVLALSETTPVEPELLASTLLNLGATYFWQGEHDQAREQYEQALAVATKAQLRFIAGRAHYNLAEVAYLQFRDSGDPADEQRGDRHTAAALTVWPHESDPAYVEATQKLKAEVLGTAAQRSADRLAPPEAVLHPAELAEVQAQRELLAVPSAPELQVRAQLRIAQAYLAVAVKEREAALALAERHGLGGHFDADLQSLRGTFERELNAEQRLARDWAAEAADLLQPVRCQAVLAHLHQAGWLNKSGYAELCGLSPATASKHLATLAQRGLLLQTGKGPSTRYQLAPPRTRSGAATTMPPLPALERQTR
jgi:tetratricopeptide (TPR) repeat protein